MTKPTFFLLSLGCAKNNVDSFSMATLLIKEGLTQAMDPEDAEFLIVNTCGFIQAAREESIQELQRLADQKKKNQFLLATGCLPQRVGLELTNRVPKIDALVSTRRWSKILSTIQNLRQHRAVPKQFELTEAEIEMDYGEIARVSFEGSSSYLKIADGCRRNCAFCSIPLIKGSQVSRPVKSIVNDAAYLAENGVKEINLIAQDTTDYGSDRGERDALARLLQELCEKTPQVFWYRILYAYPGFVTPLLIQTMTQHKQIAHYIDIPLQHADPDILKSMHRPSDIDHTKETIAALRSAMPDIAIRTTFIVGYPGETKSRFNHLLDFIEEMEFDRVGVFPFSFEPGTASARLGDPISDRVKNRRVKELMELQQGISLKKNQMQIGKTLSVLVEGNDNQVYYSRSYRDAPEIDGLVFFEEEAEVGSIVNVRITSALPYDLHGQVV